MSDSGCIGFIIHDLAEDLSKQYYSVENKKLKSHIGFGLILLDDLRDLIQKQGIDLEDNDLPVIKFYRDMDKEYGFVKNQLI